MCILFTLVYCKNEIFPSQTNESTYPHKHINQVGNEACIDDFLDLGVPSCGDVGQSPGCLLLNVGFVVAKQLGEHGQSPRIKYCLSLLICTSYNVADGTQRGRLSMGEEESF